MAHQIQSNMHANDLSFRYCSCCLKKFLLEQSSTKISGRRFFIPTIDILGRNHIAYIETPEGFLEALVSHEEKFSVDLAKIVNVLHIEISDSMSEQRKMEVESFYNYSPKIYSAAYNQIAA